MLKCNVKKLVFSSTAAERVTGISLKKEIVERRAGDPAMLIASSEKVKRELGVDMEYKEIEKIIESAYKWHKSHLDGYGDR